MKTKFVITEHPNHFSIELIRNDEKVSSFVMKDRDQVSAFLSGFNLAAHEANKLIQSIGCPITEWKQN